VGDSRCWPIVGRSGNANVKDNNYFRWRPHLDVRATDDNNDS
jgi:hypothetical protein